MEPKQGSLFDMARPIVAQVADALRRNPRRYPDAPGYSNPTTSKAAAESMEPHVTRLAAMVLERLRKCGPQTCEQVEIGLSLRRSTASARITELRLKGKIEDTGERRPTESGRKAIVWRVK